MSTALTIFLVMIASNPVDDGGSVGDPFTPAVVRATRDALGPDTRVVLRLVPTLPSDAEVVALGTAAHADAVVEVTWSLPDHLRTTIRVERPSSGRWIERDIGFRAIDDPAERSRTVGLAIVSMLPERIAHAASSPPSPPSRQHEATASPGSEGPPRPASAPAQAWTHPASSLSATALAAFDVAGQGGGFGGALDFRRRLAPRLSFRTGAAARLGRESPPEVVARFFYGAAGLVWTAWSSRDSRAALGLRLDALMMLTQFAHLPPDGTTVTKDKLMPGADLLVEGSYSFTRQVAVLAAGGGEAIFGRTDVFVDGRRAATLGPLHPVVELGFRVGF